MTTINEAIKQPHFDTSYHKAYINILYTSNFLRVQADRIFKRYNLKQQHYNVLRIVAGRKGKSITPGEIKSVMIDTGPDLTRLIDKLVNLEYLSRTTSVDNRRRRNIHLTETGQKTLAKISEEVDKSVFRNTNLSGGESEQLSELLDKVRG